ncbi:hypothetical protein QQF64_016414 [Cirrhinus molitorella]|uniref:Uncharacterized protein n=1 Tax=Cirrhinus molitorella TaxID=172907 RepID=A0ABR3LPE0_9TELE
MRLTTVPLQILRLIDVTTAAGLRMFSVVFSPQKVGFFRDLLEDLNGQRGENLHVRKKTPWVFFLASIPTIASRPYGNAILEVLLQWIPEEPPVTVTKLPAERRG